MLINFVTLIAAVSRPECTSKSDVVLHKRRGFKGYPVVYLFQSDLHSAPLDSSFDLAADLSLLSIKVRATEMQNGRS